MFSFMDGYSGYNQIRMAVKDAEKTTFRTPIRNFHYIVMPFGLKNAGAPYQRTMTAIFHYMMHRGMEDYVDDIMVKSKARAGHFQTLEQVLKGLNSLSSTSRSSLERLMSKGFSSPNAGRRKLLTTSSKVIVSSPMEKKMCEKKGTNGVPSV